MLSMCLIAKTCLFLFLFGGKFLSGESYSNCDNAGLKYVHFRRKLIDDCDLFKDNLHLAFHKITAKPYCVSQIRLVLTESTDADGYQTYYDHDIGGESAADVVNPVDGANRCVKTKISVSVTFLNSQDQSEYLEYDLNPLAKKCWETTEFTSTTDQMTVDIAAAVPVKLWETCILSVSDGIPSLEIKEPIPRRSIFVNCTTDMCRDTKHEVIYNFRGREIQTISRIFSFLKDVRSLGRGLKVISDCELLEERFNINIGQMISRPECHTKIHVKVGNLHATSYIDGVGKPNEIIDNPLIDLPQDQCVEQSVSVHAMVDSKWLSNQFFKLDPMKCFNSDAKLKLEEGDNSALIVDLTRGVAFNEKLFEKCLTEIRILDENNRVVPSEKVAGFSHLAKITSLDRLQNHTLTVLYKFKGNQVKLIQLFVPKSQKGEDNTLTLIAVAAGAGGSFLALLIVFALCIFCKKRAIESKEGNRIKRGQ